MSRTYPVLTIVVSVCLWFSSPVSIHADGPDLEDGLLVAHDFDDLEDDTGNGHDAVLVGGASLVDGKLVLDGIDGYADIGAATFGPVNPGGGDSDYTVAIDYASTNTAQGFEAGNSMLVSIGPVSSPPPPGPAGDFSLFTNNDGQYVDLWFVGAAISDQSGIGFADGTIHCAVVTYTASTSTFTFYGLDSGNNVVLNGSAVLSHSVDYSTYTPRIGFPRNSVLDADFGPMGAGGFQYLDGEVDFFAMWNRALDPSEIPGIRDLKDDDDDDDDEDEDDEDEDEDEDDEDEDEDDEDEDEDESDGEGGALGLSLASFRRGDCNDDGTVNLSDAACALDWLFAGAREPGCVAALNTNGDADVNIADPVALLNFLFGGGPIITDPFPDCGPGMLPADEQLGCAIPPNCQ